jgi:hypothetical protein
MHGATIKKKNIKLRTTYSVTRYKTVTSFYKYLHNDVSETEVSMNISANNGSEDL